MGTVGIYACPHAFAIAYGLNRRIRHKGQRVSSLPRRGRPKKLGSERYCLLRAPSFSYTPRTTRRVETDRAVEDFLENHLEGVCFAEFSNASCNELTQLERHPS